MAEITVFFGEHAITFNCSKVAYDYLVAHDLLERHDVLTIATPEHLSRHELTKENIIRELRYSIAGLIAESGHLHTEEEGRLMCEGMRQAIRLIDMMGNESRKE